MRRAFARAPGYNNRDDFRSRVSRSAARRAQRRRDLPGDPAWRARHAHRRQGERGGGREPGPRAGRVPRRGHVPVDRGAGRTSTRCRAAGSPGFSRGRRRRHPLRAAPGGGAGRPSRHRRCRRAQEDSLRAHGRCDAAHHVRGHARGLPSRRSAQPAIVRPDAVGTATDGAHGGGHELHRDVRSVARVGQDERPHQPALLVQPSRRRSVHDAGFGRRHVRLRRHGGRLLQRQVRRRSTARRWSSRSRAAGWYPRNAAVPISGRLLDLHATPTPTAIASANWPSARTSACAR